MDCSNDLVQQMTNMTFQQNSIILQTTQAINNMTTKYDSLSDIQFNYDANIDTLACRKVDTFCTNCHICKPYLFFIDEYSVIHEMYQAIINKYYFAKSINKYSWFNGIIQECYITTQLLHDLTTQTNIIINLPECT
jgi:hypothetical protein